MRLLLMKDVRRLGHVGDIVDVKAGYARNYLVPQRLGAEPTDENIQAIAQEKKRATAVRAQRQKEFERLAVLLADVSVTIEATANTEGTLYGSVGATEIAAALDEQGFTIKPAQIMLDSPIRTLDNRLVRLEFTDEISAQVKVWVVREGAEEHDDDAGEPDEPTGESDAADPDLE